MVNLLGRTFGSIRDLLRLPVTVSEYFDAIKMNQGLLLSASISDRSEYLSLSDLEFQIFSQFGDDGIIQYLTKNIECSYKTFIEFGVEDFSESNTRFLLQKDNWSGLVLDGSLSNINRLKKRNIYWKHDLEARAEFITKDNIAALLNPKVQEWKGLDLLHIDLDGNDYWIWKELELKPTILIIEYNSCFGYERSITVPYVADFRRTSAHSSNLYWGCSLKGIYDLSLEKGYSFIGCNSAGNNAYFILKNKMNAAVQEVTLERGFVASKYRESRDKSGALTYINGSKRLEEIKGMPVFNIEKQMIEAI